MKRFFFLSALLLLVSVAVRAQNLTLDLKDVPVREVIESLQRELGFSFVIKTDEIDLDRKVSVSVRDADINTVLTQVFSGQRVTFSVDGQKVQVSKADKPLGKGTAAAAAPVAPVPQHVVRGRVTDPAGEPLIGCIVVPGKTPAKAVTTDLDGYYSVGVPKNGSLEFSYIGSHTVVEEVAGRNVINVVLRQKVESLEAVMVVGYGSTSRRLVSSSIASVSPDEIEKGADIDPVKALQGRVTGMSVSSSSGIPGTAPRVIIRGVSSISGNSSPLYVVDGIPAESYPNVNANDIESMEVLKDASATAIYGSRANSGVILITTKSGHKGKTQVRAGVYGGGAMVSHDIIMANTAEYTHVMGVAVDNYNAQANALETLYVPENPVDFDWMAAVSRKVALRNGASASVSGGDAKTRFYSSVGYENEQGYLNTTGFRKVTGRLV